MTKEDLTRVPAPTSGPEPIGIIGAPAHASSGEKNPEAATQDGSGGEGEDEEDVEARLAYESLMRHRKKRRRKRLLAAGVAGGVILAALLAWAGSSMTGTTDMEAPLLQTIPVFREEFSESVQATGTAQPLSSVVVTPEIDGIIDTVNVAEGSTVNKGDVLLTIRNDDLDRAVREAEIGVRSQKASLASAQETYNQTYESYAAGPQYEQDPESGEWVKVSDGTPWSEVQQAQAAVDSAQLSLESAQQAYDQAVENAGKRTITAPSSGSVVVMNAIPGAALGAGAGSSGGGSSSSLIQIADLSQMTVSVQVNEVDISRIAVGQAARVSFSALPDVLLDGEVTRISTVASSSEYGYDYGVVTYDVEVLIPHPDPQLKPGMTATVEIMLQQVPDTLTVPVSSLMTDDGVSYYVYVLTNEEEQTIERRDVTVTAQSATTAAVEGDLSEGDLVVLDPFSVDPSTVDNAGGSAGGGAGEQYDGLDSGDDPGSDPALEEDLDSEAVADPDGSYDVDTDASVDAGDLAR